MIRTYVIDSARWLFDSSAPTLGLRPAVILDNAHQAGRRSGMTFEHSAHIAECLELGRRLGVTPKPPRAGRRAAPQGNPKPEAVAA